MTISPRSARPGGTWRVSALAVVLALALAGCKATGSERALARFGGGAYAGASDAATADAADSRAGPADATGASAQTAARPEPESPAPEAVPAEVDARPARLMGLAPEALDAELGPPELVRREAPAEVWQYHARACVLDVFLYSTGGGGREVLHLEARDAVSAEPADAEACLATLLRRELARGPES